MIDLHLVSIDLCQVLTGMFGQNWQDFDLSQLNEGLLQLSHGLKHIIFGFNLAFTNILN